MLRLTHHDPETFNSSYSPYETVEFKLHEYLAQIQEMLILPDAESSALSVIEEDKDFLKTEKYRIAVVGEFKRGRSSYNLSNYEKCTKTTKDIMVNSAALLNVFKMSNK